MFEKCWKTLIGIENENQFAEYKPNNEFNFVAQLWRI